MAFNPLRVRAVFDADRALHLVEKLFFILQNLDFFFAPYIPQLFASPSNPLVTSILIIR